MIKSLKRTPISIWCLDGYTDYFEVLVEDDSLGDFTRCDKCCYCDRPSFDLDLAASCADINGCTMSPNRYFILEPFVETC